MTGTGRHRAYAAADEQAVHRDEVDGVPVFWSRWGELGQLRAELMFRSGVVDEPAAHRGVGHLVEHLVLNRIGVAPHAYNGSVSPLLTSFVTVGDETEVVDFLGQVCSGLGELDGDRIEHERRVLAIEGSQRGGGLSRQLAVWRYGAQSHGLTALDEIGLPQMTGEHVNAWARAFLTSGNAAVALSGPPPRGLRLALPGGPHRSIPAMPTVLPRLPAWFRTDLHGVGAQGVVTRSAAAMAFVALLGHRLFQRLRMELGAAYTPEVDYSPRDALTAHVTFFSQSLPDLVQQVSGAAVAEVTRIAAGDIETDQLETWRRQSLRAVESADGAETGSARNHLMRAPDRSRAELAEEITAVRPADIVVVAQEWRATALYAVSEQAALDLPDLVAAKQWSTRRVDGRSYVRADGSSGGTLVVSGDAIMLDLGQARRVTIPFDECVAMVAVQPSQRHLVGRDGMTLLVDADVWSGGVEVLRRLDSAVSPKVVVREAGRPPAPAPTGAQAAAPAAAGATPTPAQHTAAPAVSLPRSERDVPLPTRAVQGHVRLFGARVLLRIFLLGAAVASRVAWWLSPGDSAPPTGVDWAITALFAVFFVWSLVPVGGYLLARRRRRLAPVPGALPPDLYVLEPSRFAWPSAQPGGAVDD